MRYFRARRYVHASIDGVKTLCGLQCNTFGCHWESDLWREVKAADFDYSPCLKCKKSRQLPKQLHVLGRQISLRRRQ